MFSLASCNPKMEPRFWWFPLNASKNNSYKKTLPHTHLCSVSPSKPIRRGFHLGCVLKWDPKNIVVSFWFPYIQPAKSTSFKQQKDRHTHTSFFIFLPLKPTRLRSRGGNVSSKRESQPNLAEPLLAFNFFPPGAPRRPRRHGLVEGVPAPFPLPQHRKGQQRQHRIVRPASERLAWARGGGPGISPRSGGFLRRKTRKLRIQVA